MYAAPAHYDARTRHTPVTADGVHFWVQVLLPCGVWAEIEPTPGYELLAPSPTWTELAAAWLSAARGWASGHWMLLAGLTLSGAIVAAQRRRLLDLGATGGWVVVARRPSRRTVLITLRLLEARSRWAGLARPPDQTRARWYGRFEPGETESGLRDLVRLGDWALYAPVDSPRPRNESMLDLSESCHVAVSNWTLGRFKELSRAKQRGGVSS